MTFVERPSVYRGGYLIGFILIAATTLRAILFYQGQPSLNLTLALIAVYTLLYTVEPWLAKHVHWHTYFYFPVQVGLVITLSIQRPFLDFHTVLYFPLIIQVFRTFSRTTAIGWTILFVILLAGTFIPGLGPWEGLALLLLNLATGTFLISYDHLYSQAQADQAESQRLLANLQAADRRLQEQAAQAEDLAAARARNQLARELHDSVSQTIFSIRLTSQAARLLLEREPGRAAGEIERLQEMTSSALSQLRSLIAELRPQTK
jgi:signal transduction histidine kinase